MDALGQAIADSLAGFHGCMRPCGKAGVQKAGCRLSGLFALGGDEVHQVVDMEDVAAGKNAGNRGLQEFIHHGSAGAGMKFDAGLFAQGVFRQKADGEQKGVHGKGFFRTGNRPAVFIHLGDGHGAHPFPPLDVCDRVGQIEGNLKILQALL